MHQHHRRPLTRDSVERAASVQLNLPLVEPWHLASTLATALGVVLRPCSRLGVQS